MVDKGCLVLYWHTYSDNELPAASTDTGAGTDLDHLRLCKAGRGRHGCRCRSIYVFVSLHYAGLPLCCALALPVFVLVALQETTDLF